ncbi:hypothetical protein ACLOJK_012972 [Asimina triloba]
MDTISVNSREEEAPLLGAEKPAINHARDIHLLSCAFLFVFLAYSAVQNLESTLNTEQALGSTSMGILYLSLTLFSFVASPLVRLLGSKYALVLGTTGYWLFMAANLRPSWIGCNCFMNGWKLDIVEWSSEEMYGDQDAIVKGTYLTSAARSHAKDSHLHEGTVLGNFNGEFWGLFASNQVTTNKGIVKEIFKNHLTTTIIYVVRATIAGICLEHLVWIISSDKQFINIGALTVLWITIAGIHSE